MSDEKQSHRSHWSRYSRVREKKVDTQLNQLWLIINVVYFDFANAFEKYFIRNINL